MTRHAGSRIALIVVCGLFFGIALRVSAAPPSWVDITWMSISNMYYQVGPLKIITDGYFTRIPESTFFGGGGGLASSKSAFAPDIPAITRVMNALGGPSQVNLLLTGHSHFDHSFDTAAWSRLTGARIIGSKTTCLQAQAQKIDAARCRAVSGREVIRLADGLDLRVVRWNHSGDPNVNPEQHDPVELRSVPVPDPEGGGLHPGVAEDFPNGGGNRAFLFTLDAPQGRISWFFQNSGSAVDLHLPIVVDGVDYGSPLENLKLAMKDARLASIDLWIGSGGRAIAELVAPTLKPKAYLPVHWDGLYGAFEKGVPRAYSDQNLEQFLQASNIKLVRPTQYMDKWRLDHAGVAAVDNTQVKKALGF